MKTTVDFLNDVKARYDIKSNYALAKLMGQTDTAVARWMHGKNTLSDETAVKVAELLEIEPSFIMACIAAERSKNPAVKKAWAWTAEHLGGLAAALALVAVLPFVPGIGADNLSGIALLGFTTTEGGALYIMSNMLADYWPLLAALATLALLAFPRYRRR